LVLTNQASLKGEKGQKSKGVSIGILIQTLRKETNVSTGARSVQSAVWVEKLRSPPTKGEFRENGDILKLDGN